MVQSMGGLNWFAFEEARLGQQIQTIITLAQTDPKARVGHFNTQKVFKESQILGSKIFVQCGLDGSKFFQRIPN